MWSACRLLRHLCKNQQMDSRSAAMSIAAVIAGELAEDFVNEPLLMDPTEQSARLQTKELILSTDMIHPESIGMFCDYVWEMIKKIVPSLRAYNRPTATPESGQGTEASVA